ncbi:hypothetical protein [Candidatus Coxiella mudrowiae]|uniref:hypothetical protein n=1 Tax=Candidatus Coxiella mudrowiae TaxID=2054173 RepID=UPI000C28BDFD|nr:hypothetical protein [Candidatus Coxiella mudrowiae]
MLAEIGKNSLFWAAGIAVIGIALKGIFRCFGKLGRVDEQLGTRWLLGSRYGSVDTTSTIEEVSVN